MADSSNPNLAETSSPSSSSPSSPSPSSSSSSSSTSGSSPSSSSSSSSSAPSLHEELRGNPIYFWVSQILLWRHPLESGLYCAIVNLFLLLLTLGDYTAVTLVSYLLLSFLLLCALYVHSTLFKSVVFENKSSSANPLDEWASTPVQITPEDVEQHVAAVVLLANGSLNFLRRVYTLQDKLLSLKFGLLLFLLGLLGRLFSTSFLFHLAAVFAFGWPLLYQKHHAKIDAQLDKLLKPISSILEKVAPPKPKKKAE